MTQTYLCQMYLPGRGLVLHQVNLTFTVRCKISLTCTVRHTQLRCTPSRAIWWTRAVLHQVILTFAYPLGHADLSFFSEHF